MDEQPLALLNNRFTVDIDSSSADRSRRDVGFESISSIKSVRSSTLNKLFNRIIGSSPRQCVEFRRAVQNDPFFFDWHNVTLCRKVDLRTVTIYQLAQQTDKPVNIWRLEDCWIHAWHGPEFNAMEPGVAYETFTLRYRSVDWLEHSVS